MGHSKPKPVGPSRAVCPICGQTAYSPGGIHPQCAVVQADQRTPRIKPEPSPPKPAAKWTKRCPRCKRELPARRVVCDCGYSYQLRPATAK